VNPRAAETRSRDFAGTLDAVAEAETWFAIQSATLGLDPDVKFAMGLCLEELLVNAVKHGCAGRATVSLSISAEGPRLELVDDGGAFDPTRAAAKRIEGPDHDFDIGGYGSGLVRSFAKLMSYRRADGLNRIVLGFAAGRGGNPSHGAAPGDAHEPRSIGGSAP